MWCLQLNLRVEHELTAQDAQFVGALQRAGELNLCGAFQHICAVHLCLILTNQDDFRLVALRKYQLSAFFLFFPQHYRLSVGKSYEDVMITLS